MVALPYTTQFYRMMVARKSPKKMNVLGVCLCGADPQSIGELTLVAGPRALMSFVLIELAFA